MDRQRLNRILRNVLPWYLFALWLGVIMMMRWISQVEPCAFGDWLIHYGSGWVRRGLCGSLLLNVGSFFQIPPIDLLIGFLAILYGLFFYLSGSLLLRRDVDLVAYTWLVFGPAIFPFPLHAAGIGFRKEILYLVVLVSLAWIAVYRKQFLRKVLQGALFIYPFLLLCHEMLIVFLPYLFVIYYKEKDWSWHRDKGLIALVWASIGVSVWNALFPKVTWLRLSLMAKSLPIQCPNPFVALTMDVQDAWEMMLYYVHQFRYFEKYSISLLLISLAFIPIRRRVYWIWRQTTTRILVLLSFFGTGLLAAIMVDWGRLLYIQVASLFVVSLLPTKTPSEHRLISPVWVMLLAVYSLGWHVPLCCRDTVLGTFYIVLIWIGKMMIKS